MVFSKFLRRAADYKPALAWFAAVGAAWVFVLVMLGAFTTSIGAGMAFPDWPLSNGSLNPDGWLSDLAKFAEHSHRLSGALMGLITIVLAVWLWRREERAWLRWLGWGALILVIVQGVVGGLRVLLEGWHVEMIDTSAGRFFAMLHACLAQVFVCTLFAIAAALSRSWLENSPASPGADVRRLGIVSCTLLLAQLAVAAVMRHSFAGLAIPTFPLTPEGGLIPAHWDFKVGIHFAHRAMAVVLTGTLLWLVIAVWRSAARQSSVGFGLQLLASLVAVLLSTQIALGAMTVWTGRNPYYTTAHVLVGALTLAATFLLTWIAHRDVLEATQFVGAPNPLVQQSRIAADAG